MAKILYLLNSKMAFPSLMRLHNEGVLAAAVVPDVQPEVVANAKMLSEQAGFALRLLSKANFKTELNEILQETKPDAALVMTFPWKIPGELLAMPPMGFLNFHHGKLPEMRGADPMFECIRQRMKEATSTVHLMVDELDAGPVLIEETIPVQPDLTYGMLAGRMAYLGEQICGKLVAAIKEGKLPEARPQDEANAKYWPKVTLDDLKVDWNKMDWMEIKALVKSCNPSLKGGIPVRVNGWQIGIHEVIEVNLEGDTGTTAPGTILTTDVQNGVIVYCKGGKGLKLEVIYSEEGILPGYKLAYYGIQPGMVFS